MCKKSTTKQTKDVPAWVEEAGQQLVSQGQELADKPFEPYTGERVAGFSSDQDNAFQAIRDLIGGAPQVGPGAIAGAQTYGSAPAQQIDTERVVDEGGRLGAISDYLNPYADAALQPALAKIMDAADQARKRISSGATSARAFGDARHGILESDLDATTSETIGDTASKFFMDAFNQAMGLRTGDLNRFGQVDLANANFNEQALKRLLEGSGKSLEFAQTDQKRMLEQIQALLSGGTLQQANEQAGMDAAFQEFMREYGHDYNVLNALAGALKGTQGSFDITTTTEQPDNSLLGAGGAIAGKALPFLLAPATGGASLAAASLDPSGTGI